MITSMVSVTWAHAVRPGGWDRTTEDIPKEMDKEIAQAFENVEHTLKEAGGKGWEQVYKVRAYFAPLDMAEAGPFIEMLRKYCPNHQPLLTAVGVEKLAFENMRVEIEVSAHLGS